MARVISELLGIPQRQRRMLHVLTGLQTRTDNSAEQVLELDRQISELLHGLIEHRRATPADDLVSHLIWAHDNGKGRLSEEELTDMVVSMFFAGHQSIINMITNASYGLLTHPEQLAMARSGAVSWSAVVEEAIRWNGAVNHFPMRYPMQDIDIDGIRIRRGEAILASFGSAGRDPMHHGHDADVFDARRRQAGHLGFGYGPHFCLGVHVARMQLEVALSALFERFPELRLAVSDPAQWQPVPVASFVSNSIESLPVVLGPQRCR